MTDDRPVLCCPDKFRGSLTALEAAQALGEGVEHGPDGASAALADGGEEHPRRALPRRGLQGRRA